MGEGLAGWGAQRAARTAGPPAGGRKYNIAPSGRLQREFPLAGDLFAGPPLTIQTFEGAFRRAVAAGQSLWVAAAAGVAHLHLDGRVLILGGYGVAGAGGSVDLAGSWRH